MSMRRIPQLVLAVVVVLGLATFTGGSASAQPAQPEVPGGSGTGRRIVYSVGQQRVWLVESDGSVRNTHLVSGHKGGTIPARGTYKVFSKSIDAFNGKGSFMHHMVRFAQGATLAIGFHSIPTDAAGVPLQSISQLGTPLSSGCVRQAPADAELLYKWSPIGTKVVVVK